MFWGFFRLTGEAVVQSFLMAAIGFFLTKRDILHDSGLDAISRIVIAVTLPAMIFSQLVRDFSFSLYPNWWIFPLLSIGVTLAGFMAGSLFQFFFKKIELKRQFLSLITFQNSGYLPLVLIAGILPKDEAGVAFIYIFLFLLGFNFMLFSLGVFMLSPEKKRGFEPAAFLNPPVLATLFSLLFVFFGLNKFMPGVLLKPLQMAGDCTLPLAMFVLGGNLAEIKLQHIDQKGIILMTLAKLIMLPLLGLLLVLWLRPPELIGLLIIMQMAMPPAALLSVLTRQYKQQDLLISQGIFYGHLIGLITIPLFLSLYFMINVVR